jgi:4-amino-4-deoxy-L-arabinose transferase-like glycosyltransferase
MLYLVPRVIMGLLAIVDTFLVYKIAERRYSRNVAVIASVLFAVTPSLLYSRWILLDNILLPFFLSSILFALYHYRKDSKYAHKYDHEHNKSLIPILLSGVFLGLAIFTKIPTFTMIPVVGFLIFTNSNRCLRVLGLWLFPVILIPLIWPAYSISSGQFNGWLNGIAHQETRGIHYEGDKVLSNALNQFFQIDPVLVVLGICDLEALAPHNILN